jgi:hypothetical protein
MKKLINPRTGVLALMIVLAGVWRLLVTTPLMTPLSNFTPIGAMALFGGCYYKSKWKAFLVPLATLWISDVIIDSVVYYHSLTWFYDGFLWTYATFALMGVMGMFIKKVNIKSIVIAGFVATFAHWIITDFGVWLSHGIDVTTGKPYTYDLAGLWKCLLLALPYEKNLLVGNLVFGGVLFGAFEWAQRKYPMLRIHIKPTITQTH